MSDTTIRGPVPPAPRTPAESGKIRPFTVAPAPSDGHRDDPAVFLDPALAALEDAVAGAPGKGGVSAGPALREALDRLRDDLSVLFLLMGYSEWESGQLADAVIGRIDEDIRQGKGPGANIMDRIEEVLAEPPPAAEGAGITTWESVSMVLAIEELDVTLTTEAGTVSVSYKSVSVSVEHTLGVAVGQWGGDPLAFDATGMPADLATADSGLFFGPGADWLRGIADDGTDRPFDDLLLVHDAGRERLRLGALMPIARSDDGAWEPPGKIPPSEIDAVV
jgi:hypothetical protein